MTFTNGCRLLFAVFVFYSSVIDQNCCGRLDFVPEEGENSIWYRASVFAGLEEDEPTDHGWFNQLNPHVETRRESEVRVDESVPSEMNGFLSDNQILGIGPLTSSDLQEIESMGNEMDNSERNNLHSESTEEETWGRLDLVPGKKLPEEGENSICWRTSAFTGIGENEPTDHGRFNQLNPHVESRREKEERGDEVVGLDKRVVVIDSDITAENRGETTADEVDKRMPVSETTADEEDKQMHVNETTEPDLEDEVDKQMHVNETTVDHNCSRGGAKRTERECGITFRHLQQQSGKKMDDAAESLGVSRSTFKRICRANGIARWSCKRILQQPATQNMATIFESDNSMSIKASYNGVNVRFPLSLFSGKKDLEVEVEKRFGIQTGSFWIKYEDEDKDWILITCDQDLHHGMHTCIGRGITTMKMLVNYDLG